MKVYETIIQPVVTEKSSRLAEHGKYVFLVNKNATKIDVKNALKELYDVEVGKVTMARIQPKSRLVARGKEMTKRKMGKKAMVSIKGDKSLDVTKFKSPKKAKPKKK